MEESGMSSVRWDDDAPTKPDVSTSHAALQESHTSAEPMPEYTATIEETPSFATHPANRPKDAEDERTKLVCQVSNPNREAHGSRESYVSYLVSTSSSLPVFSKPDFRVRRRYNDFVFLHSALTQRYPACAIPPLPDRHASAYLKGGRFDTDFTNRRCTSLNTFLNRCTLHPDLKRASELHTFLESGDWNAFTRSSHHNRRATMDGGGSMMEGITDTLMGAFATLGKPDKRFVDVRERSDKLARDLSHIEKLIAKIARRETDIELDMTEMAQHFVRLADIEPELEAEFTEFAKAMNQTAINFKSLRDQTDSAYYTSLRDQSAYNGAIKTLLKMRDQKQADFEALTEYQLKTTLERDQLASGYPHANFIQTKVENLRGLNHDQVRRDKLKRLEAKVEELQKETELARLTSENFDEQVVREVEIFERTKGVETKASMQRFARANIAFYRAIISDWEHVGAIETLAGLPSTQTQTQTQTQTVNGESGTA